MDMRYAIIIGINDYTINPLNYCVNDANQIKNNLIEKANFKAEHVYLITSDSSNQVKDITGKLFEILAEIKATFNDDEDSIFFYFAGHGFSADSKSFLVFQDTNFSIQDLFHAISELNPKMQFYVIDACESGNKTLTRGNLISVKEQVEEYIAASSGALFLYACQKNESAAEEHRVQHGIMTHYFIEAMNTDSLYDDDGILTPGRIQEYVSKKVPMHSNFAQVPVIENRVIGYYPFILKQNTSIAIQVPAIETTDSTTIPRQLDQYSYNRASRLKLQEIAIKKTDTLINKILSDAAGNFTITSYENIDKIALSNVSSLKDKIVSDARDNFKSINDIIFYDQKPIYDPMQKLLNPMLATLGRVKPSSWESVPTIDTGNEYFHSLDYSLISSDIWEVSFGIGAVIYQAKWGGVISPYFYRIEWDGENSTELCDIKKSNYTYLIDSDSEKQIEDMSFDILGRLPEIRSIWNKERAEELKKFKISKPQ